MRALLLSIVVTFLPVFLIGQITQDSVPDKPWYCNPPDMNLMTAKAGGSPSALPKMPTVPVTCYKVQVAILMKTHPAEHPFHPKLVARYRPCEEVWVIESRETFKYRDEAEKFGKEMESLGYKEAYVTEIMGYE